jgi:large subunit ribosomal protein L25
MSDGRHYVRVAHIWRSMGLHNRLGRFLTQYPPELYSVQHTGIALPLTRREAKQQKLTAAATAVALTDPEVSTADVESISEILSTEITQSEGQTTQTLAPTPKTSPPQPNPTSRADRLPSNPFLPFRHPATGRWAGARISLRTQAELVKLAKAHNVEHLLPPGRKSTAFKEARILERGLRVRGTGEGQKVKGHKWERQMPEMLQKRREAMEKMPALVREWQARGHGRGWKKFPKVKGPR